MSNSVLHVITGLGIGGAERALYTLLTSGLQDGRIHHVVSLLDEGHYGPLLQKAGVNVIALRLKKGIPDPVSLYRLRVIVRRINPAVVQGWMYHGNLAAYLATLFLTKAKVMWNVRISLEYSESWPLLTRILVKIEAFLSKYINTVVFNSDRSRLEHQRRGFSHRNCMVIPNGFDPEAWYPQSDVASAFKQKYGIPQTSTVFGFVGRNHPQKDVATLLRAFQLAITERPDLHLVLAGRNLVSGPSSLERPLQELGTKVTALGERDDIPNIMPVFDYFCLSSRAEGFPNVIGEAMLCEVPCISTDVGDASFIIGDTGWIVPAGDSEAFAEKILTAARLPNDKRLSLGRSARQRIKNEFSIKSVVTRYTTLYKS